MDTTGAESSKPKGPMGCPFINNEVTDPEGRNLTYGFPLKYISKHEFLFDPNAALKLGSLGTSKRKSKAPQKNMEFLNSLPWAIKHSLFLDEESMARIRKLDFGNLFFAADDTKGKGNEAYEQGRYYEALQIYE